MKKIAGTSTGYGERLTTIVVTSTLPGGFVASAQASFGGCNLLCSAVLLCGDVTRSDSLYPSLVEVG